jgi:hypothetical protein
VCDQHLLQRGEDCLVQRPDGLFVCTSNNRCKPKQWWNDNRPPYQQSNSQSTTRGDYRYPVPEPEIVITILPTSRGNINPQQGHANSTPSAQSENVDLWSTWNLHHPSVAAQDSPLEHGSTPELGSVSFISQAPQVSLPAVQNSVSIITQAPQVSPPAAQNSVFATDFEMLAAQASDPSSLQSLALLELSPSAPAEETSSCIYRDVRVSIALMAAELDAPHSA